MIENEESHEYTLQELADKTGISPRTVRFYISKDLLPPPIRAGRDAAYNHAHIERLEAIRAHKDQGYTLNEIRSIVSTGKTEKTLPEPTYWQCYKVADDVQVNVRSDAPPWRFKSILKQIQRMAQELEEAEG